MGLFGMVHGEPSEPLTPFFIFATSLMYMMAADGEMDSEEIGLLLAVIGAEKREGVIAVGGNQRELLNRAMKYARTHPLDEFLAEAAPQLTDAQRMCILINLVDSAFADGSPEAVEQQLFYKFLQAFGVSEERFRPFFEVIMLKHDRQLFHDPNHPRNQAGQIVRLNIA